MINTGPNNRGDSIAKGAITPDHTPVEVAERLSNTVTDYVTNATDKMEVQYWVARLLGELFTTWEILQLARKQGRDNVNQELITSIKRHHVWADAIKKFRVNWLINVYEDIPLSNAKVRLRELSDLYYKLTGKAPSIKHVIDVDGSVKATVDEDNLESFDPDTSVVEIEYGKDGKKVKVERKHYYEQCTKILEQIRVELERMDTTLMDDAEFIKIIRECGYDTYDV